MTTPLRKRTLEGTLYKRDAKVEALLAKLELLPRAELIAQCQITHRNDPGYVPSECIMYFVRATRRDNSDKHFERLYKILLSRLMHSLPNPETNDGEVIRISQTKSRIREVAFDRFTEALATDREAYSEKLDYFEVRFDGAVANLRRDAQDTAWREENRTTTIEYDPDTNDPSPEGEEAAGSFNPFQNLEENDYRSRLDAAIDTLPPEQIRIIQMLRQGFPRFRPRPRKSRQHFSFLIGHRQLNRLPPLRHEASPRSANRKRGIRQQIIRSITADFMESIV